MEETTGKWIGLIDALPEIVSAQVWDQCRVAWEACQSKGGYAALARAFAKSYFAYNARVHGSTSPARNMRPPVRPPELNGMDAAVSLLQGEIVTFLCSGVERVRFYRRRQGDYQTPPNESWRRCALQYSDPRTESSSFEDFFRSYWVQCGTPDWIPVECIQIFRAEETAAFEPAVSSVKKPGGPGRPEKAETKFARSVARGWLEEEGERLSEYGKQSKCEQHVLDQLAKNGLELSLTKVRTVVKEESAKLEAEKEDARKSANNWNGQ
ncbi:hypothetical protein [Gluconobacter vitians]|uniref:hypothetical protein n=1 Tax=Gluconobacter vitians TaxID=2728102 RepID=UPI0018854F80|nr:hypothetical protein [Gluconobacter vitians]